MYLFFLLSSICLLIWSIKNILFWVGLWQDKEYRVDRLLAHFKETVQGRNIFFSFGNVIKWALFISAFILSINFIFIFVFLIVIVFVVQAAQVLFAISRRKIKHPAFTKKAILLCILSFVFVFVLYLYPPFNPFFWILVIDRFIPVIVSLFVALLAIPTFIYKKVYIKKASEKMKVYKDILVIAVSGSYGKTSTKEYIAQVLSEKFLVVKTPGSNNTPIGIATTIMKEISDKTKVFVVEVGSYKIGEIKEICKIIKPKITVTTAISDQHLSLYGSIENVLLSEYELIAEATHDGFSLFNSDSPNITTLFEKTKRQKVFYGTEQKKNRSLGIFAKNIKSSEKGVTFDIIFGKQKVSLKTSLLGTHVVENILPAVYIAKYLRVNDEEIKKKVFELFPPAKTMKKIILKNGAIAIDDSFNSSPESIFSALEFLNFGKQKKYFVFSPLVELGKNASERHVEIGEKIGRTCDHVFVLNNNFRNEIIKGVGEQNTKTKISFLSLDKTHDMLANILEPEDIVIFEGKEAGVILKKLTG